MDSSEGEDTVTWLDRFSLGILQFIVSVTFLARGWLTWRWDSPIRELIWEEKWWSPVLKNYEVTWSHFARTSDQWITPALERLGIFLMVSSLIPWVAGFSRLRWLRWFFIPAILILILDGFSRWVGKDMQAGMAMEHLLQIFAPLGLLISLGRKSFNVPKRDFIVRWLLIIAAAVTFVGHGLYAVGYYSVPLHFQMMTTEILSLSEGGSLRFLEIFGWLDFLVVPFIFLPWTRWMALFYMFCWGGATTLARILAYYDDALPYNGMDPWFAEAMVRTSHWAIPFWLCWLLWRKRKQSRSEDLVQS
jgi:hypothetical protein